MPSAPLSSPVEVPPVPLPERALTEADREALANREGVEDVLAMVRVDAPAGTRLAGAATAFLLVHRAGWTVYDFGPCLGPDAPRAGWRRVWATSTPADTVACVVEASAALSRARRCARRAAPRLATRPHLAPFNERGNSASTTRPPAPGSEGQRVKAAVVS